MTFIQIFELLDGPAVAAGFAAYLYGRVFKRHDDKIARLQAAAADKQAMEQTENALIMRDLVAVGQLLRENATKGAAGGGDAYAAFAKADGDIQEYLIQQNAKQH